MNSRRFGRFTLPDNLVREQPYQVAQMLASIKFLPTRVQYLFHTEQFEYIGISERFDEYESGCEPPEYDICIVESAEGEPIEVNVTRKYASFGVMHPSVIGLVPEFYGNAVGNSLPDADGIVVTIPDEPQSETDY